MSTRRKRRRGMNLTPLIDVVFLVLAFLLVCSRIDVRRALEVDLPRAEGTREVAADTVLLVISPAGMVHLGDAPISMDELPARLAALPPRATLEIRPDENAPAGALVRVMDTVRQSGRAAAHIAVVSETGAPG